MNNRFILALTTVLAIAAAVLGALRLTGGGSVFSTVSLLVIVIVFSLSFLFRIRKDWLAILLIASMWGSMVNLPLLDIFTYGFILQLTILALVMAERIVLRKQASWQRNWGEKAILLFAILLAIELIVEHPGSARLGGGGGLGQMIYYVCAGWIFLLTSLLAREGLDEGRLAHLFGFGSFAFTAYIVTTRIVFGSQLAPFYTLFWSAGFPMFAFILGWTMQRWMSRKGTLLAVVFALLFVLGAALYSQFRACPYIAIMMIFLIALVNRVRTRFWLLMAGVLLGLVLMASFLPEQMIPDRMRRSLSTWRAIDPSKMQVGGMGEFGWEFEFRATLWNMAKRDIFSHPFAGSGWNFSFDEIISAVGQGGIEGVITSNALAGGYHNGLLTLAAKAGLPVASSFLFAFIYLLSRFVRHVRRDANSRLLASVLVGTLVGEMVIFMSNGGGQESVHIAILLGVMESCSARWSAQHQPTVAAIGLEPKGRGAMSARGVTGRQPIGRLPARVG